MSNTPLLKLKSISKSYPGCLANDSIDLQINGGQVHALLGENGAGKSTLVKIIYGILKADSGQLFWEGKQVEISNPAGARELGIAMVFQHFSLFDSLTVADNIALGMDKYQDKTVLEAQIAKVSQSYGLPLDPNQYVYTMSVGERQRIEIVRCLIQHPRLLVMDEPTSVLTPQEVQTLFKTLRRLASEGMAILYISHKLEEIKQLCEKATILRHGKRVAEAIPKEETAKSLASLMIGSNVKSVQNNSNSFDRSGSIRLRVKHLTSSDFSLNEKDTKLKNISFDVRQGEIVGIAGVAGNGQIELLEALAGETLGRKESLLINGCECGDLSPRMRRKLGMCSVPEQRLGHAAVPEMSLADNAFLTAFQRQGLLKFGFIRKSQRNRFTDQIIDTFSVLCGGHRSVAASLSGGNLQKFIVGSIKSDGQLDFKLKNGLTDNVIK